MMAALGQVQLARLPDLNARRREISALYRLRLAEMVPDVVVPFASHESEAACHILPTILPADCDRGAVMAAMKKQGIQTSIHYLAVHRMSAYASGAAADLPRTEEFCRREVTLPLYPSMTPEDVGLVCSALSSALQPR
jgi:dTDP-4-amino-4,6-dideoxygalactose transaminase